MSKLRQAAVGMIIYLGWLLPATSSNLPKAGGPRQRFDSVLLRMGFTCAPAVTREAVVSYTALPPLPRSFEETARSCCATSPSSDGGGIFLLHYPWSRLHRTLSGILPCEARTFLTCRHTDMSVRKGSRDYPLYSTYLYYHPIDGFANKFYCIFIGLLF